MLAKAGTLFGVVAITGLLAGSVGAAAMEQPARPMIDVAPAAQTAAESKEGPVVPAQPLPDPTTTTTTQAPVRRLATNASAAPTAGTAVSFTITPRTQ